MLRIYVKVPPAPVEVVVVDPVKYGLLYNWYAATDARLICAAGWEVPTNVQLQALSNYLGGDTVSGGKLKETGLTYWATPNTGATNEVGFNGRGAGRRSSPTGGLFDVTIGSQLYLLSNYFSGNLYVYVASYNDDNFGLAFRQKADGMSIRPIKTTTTLTHGQTGTYTGNDGKVYRTICIGTQEWLADNLAETKFRYSSITIDMISPGDLSGDGGNFYITTTVGIYMFTFSTLNGTENFDIWDSLEMYAPGEIVFTKNLNTEFFDIVYQCGKIQIIRKPGFVSFTPESDVFNAVEITDNDNYIPGFDGGVYTPFTNAAWAALTTGALCAYNNDWSNV